MVIYVLWISMVHHLSSAPWLPPYRPSATHLPGSWQLQLAKWEALSGPHATNNDLIASDSNVWTSVGRVVLWRLWRCGMHMMPKCPWNQHPLLERKIFKQFNAPSENPPLQRILVDLAKSPVETEKKKVLKQFNECNPRAGFTIGA